MRLAALAPVPARAPFPPTARPRGPRPGRWRAEAAGPADAVRRADRGAGGEVLLRAAGAGKVYGGVRAVDGVDLELRGGEVLGIIGPNGAGKSTLIGLLSGAIAGEGRVELFGADVTAVGAQQRARRGIGRTHQVPRPFGQMTVLDNLLVAHLHGAKGAGRAARAECERILARCGLTEFAGTGRPTSACCASSGSSWPGRWRSGHGSCCSTRSARAWSNPSSAS